MARACWFLLPAMVWAGELVAQSTLDVPRPEEKQKQEHAIAKQQEKRAQRATIVQFVGQQAFKEKDLRSAVKEPLATVDEYGLTPARADDLAFFLELFYRKHGYAKVAVHYAIERADRVLLLETPFYEHSQPYPGRIADYPPGPLSQRTIAGLRHTQASV